MARKYRNGQKVKIIEVRDQHGHLKYPQIQEYINETGIIIGSEFTSIRNLAGMEEYAPGDFYIYQVRLNKGITLEAVLEDALVVLDE